MRISGFNGQHKKVRTEQGQLRAVMINEIYVGVGEGIDLLTKVIQEETGAVD